MKPRFSILTLLGFTAYVAVNIVGFAYPDSVWNSLAVCLWMAAVLTLGLKCVTQEGDDQVFIQGMFIGTMTYAVASASQTMLFVGWQRNWEFMFTPHGWLVILLMGDDLRGSNQFWADVAAINRLAMMDASLIFGYAFGCLTVWRYRRLERRATQETQ